MPSLSFDERVTLLTTWLKSLPMTGRFNPKLYQSPQPTQVFADILELNQHIHNI